MGLIYIEEDGPDEVTPCELNNNDLAVVAIVDEPVHAQELKALPKCSAYIN